MIVNKNEVLNKVKLKLKYCLISHVVTKWKWPEKTYLLLENKTKRQKNVTVGSTEE